MQESDEAARFEQVDWDEIGTRNRRLSSERAMLLAGLFVLFALYLYDRFLAHVYFVGTIRMETIDWVILLAAIIVLSYGMIPMRRNQKSVRRVLRELSAKPTALLVGGYLLALFLIGALGPLFVSDPGLRFEQAFNPPIGVSTQVTPFDCFGEVTGPPLDQSCHGSLSYPLGTNERGHPLGFLLVSGARVALYVTLFAAAFVIPLAATVGVIAGLYGGLLDDLLMGYVDIQLSIPAIVLYFLGYAYWNPSLLLLLLTFGLLSWGGIARLVRSEVLQRREDGHVLVARSLGASRLYIAKRHILPNVTNTLVPAVFHLLAMLVLIEAGIAFLGFHELELYSWGSTISESVNAAVPGYVQSRADEPAYLIWWVSTLPALALTATILSFKLLGDSLRDALDPRHEGER
jgi:peptide/nickel transport system permease protein